MTTIFSMLKNTASSVWALVEDSKETKRLKHSLLSGEIAKVMTLVQNNPDLINTPFTTPFGQEAYPLHAAIRLNKRLEVSFMIEQGADVNKRDLDGRNGIDYAIRSGDKDLIDAVLNIEKSTSRSRSFEPANTQEVSKFRSKILKEAPLASTLLKPYANYNTASHSQGVTPLHIAAAQKDISTLQKMIAVKGDIYAKNEEGISAADLLFEDVTSNDPLNVNKMQLILGLISLSSIATSLYLNEDSASAWQYGLGLLSIGADATLSYNAYLQLSPESVLEKCSYLVASIGSFALPLMITKTPLKMLWDAWRVQAVCSRAYDHLKCAIRNYTYNPIDSLKLVGVDLLTVSTTAYQTMSSFEGLRKRIFGGDATHLNELENETKQCRRDIEDCKNIQSKLLQCDSNAQANQKILNDTISQLQKERDLNKNMNFSSLDQCQNAVLSDIQDVQNHFNVQLQAWDNKKQQNIRQLSQKESCVETAIDNLNFSVSEKELRIQELEKNITIVNTESDALRAIIEGKKSCWPDLQGNGTDTTNVAQKFRSDFAELMKRHESKLYALEEMHQKFIKYHENAKGEVSSNKETILSLYDKLTAIQSEVEIAKNSRSTILSQKTEEFSRLMKEYTETVQKENNQRCDMLQKVREDLDAINSRMTHEQAAVKQWIDQQITS
ncbi:MAG: hypothetical protein WCG42_04075 [Parachlamydiaceae bacterium]